VKRGAERNEKRRLPKDGEGWEDFTRTVTQPEYYNYQETLWFAITKLPYRTTQEGGARDKRKKTSIKGRISKAAHRFI